MLHVEYGRNGEFGAGYATDGFAFDSIQELRDYLMNDYLDSKKWDYVTVWNDDDEIIGTIYRTGEISTD